MNPFTDNVPPCTVKGLADRGSLTVSTKGPLTLSKASLTPAKESTTGFQTATFIHLYFLYSLETLENVGILKIPV